MVRFGFIILFAFFALCSCKEQFGDENLVVMEVGGESLYLKDVLASIPSGLNAKDSASAVEKYKKEWATNILLYNKAKENMPNTEEIDILVERYRRELFIYEYQLQKIKQNQKPIKQKEIEDYYYENSDIFLASETMVGGFSVVVPNDNPDLKELRKLFRGGDENMHDIEALCVKNGLRLDLFSEKMKPLSLVKREGMQIYDTKEFLAHHRFFESKGDNITTLLFINSSIIQGETLPLEQVKASLETILIERQKNLYLKKLASDLYEDALNNGEIKQNIASK